MNSILTFLLLVLVLLAPFGITAALAKGARMSGYLRLHPDQFRFGAPLAGRMFDNDADLRRVEHDIQAIQSRSDRR